uniref:C-type lectin domain-containing protein n=1 Tax=Plectus sambesii TaxID=2011161 RepID=A0A914WBE3_9BILA
MITKSILLMLWLANASGKNLSTDCVGIADLSGMYDSNSSKCISLYSTAKNWTDAYDDCAARGMRNSYLGRLLTQIDDELWTFVTTNFGSQLSGVWIGVCKSEASGSTLSNVFWALTPKTELSNTSIVKPSKVGLSFDSDQEKCYRVTGTTSWNDMTCNIAYKYLCEYMEPPCSDTDWSAWSACSQTCDQGIQSRYRIFNNGTSCNSTQVYEYQSCSSGAHCHGTDIAEIDKWKPEMVPQ